MKKIFLIIPIIVFSALPFFPAYAAITIGGYTQYSGASNTSHSFEHNVFDGENRLLIVRFSINIDGIAASVKYNGAPMTLATNSFANEGADKYAFIYYLVNPDIGNNNVVITLDNAGRIAASANTLYGVNISNPIGENAYDTPNAQATNSPTKSIATDYDNSLLISTSFGGSKNLTWTATGDNQIKQSQINLLDPSGSCIIDSYELTELAGNYSIDYSINETSATLISITEIRAAGTPTPSPSPTSVMPDKALTINAASSTDVFAAVGTLTTDLWVLLAIAMGLPLAFFVITGVIEFLPSSDKKIK